MRPIWEIGLAQTLFHEIGHHVREIRTHGIKASENEGFAERYALKSLDKYYLENERSINDFFTKLEQVVSNGGGDPKIVKSMREGWDRDLEAARTRSTES